MKSIEVIRRVPIILKLIVVIVLIAGFVSSCKDSTPAVNDYYIISQTEGDLDNDGIEELAVIYDPLGVSSSINDVPRVLKVYKKGKGTWIENDSSSSAIFGVNDGGMLGDPLDSIKIEKNKFIVYQSGGCSSVKWYDIDTYKFLDNQFILINNYYRVENICENTIITVYNAESGRFDVKKILSDCSGFDDEIKKNEAKEFTLNLDTMCITLQNRHLNKIKFDLPDGNCFFLSSGLNE